MTSPVLSIITPSLPDRDNRLAGIYAELLALPVSWEWLIRFDGQMRDPGFNDSRVTVSANGRNLGVSITRNRMLIDTSGRYVIGMDDDDLPVAAGLGALVRGLEEQPQARYAVGRTLDRFPDGDTMQRLLHIDHPVGLLPVGYFDQRWADGLHLQVHPPATVYDREALLAVGGWPAIVGMEDLDLLLTVSAAHPGLFVPADVLIYHLSPDQTIHRPWWDSERGSFLSWVRQRSDARRALAGQPKLFADPAESTPKHGDPVVDPAFVAKLDDMNDRARR